MTLTMTSATSARIASAAAGWSALSVASVALIALLVCALVWKLLSSSSNKGQQRTANADDDAADNTGAGVKSTSNHSNNSSGARRRRTTKGGAAGGAAAGGAGGGAGAGAGAKAQSTTGHKKKNKKKGKGDPPADLIKFIIKGHSVQAIGVVFSPNGRYAATSSRDGTVRILVLSSVSKASKRTGVQPLYFTIPLEHDTATALAFTEDGSVLAVGTERARELRFYSVNHKTPPVLKKAFPTQHPEPIIGLALPSFPALPASAFAVSVCSAMRDRTVKFWSPRGHALAALKTDVGAHAALVASQPARFVGVVGVSSKQAHIMSVHQTAQGKFEKAMHSMTLSGHREPLVALDIGKQGDMMVTASEDWSFRVWDTSMRHTMEDYEAKLVFHHLTNKAITAIALSPDGATVAVATSDGLQFYRSATGDKVGDDTPVEDGVVTFLRYTPEGDAVASLQAGHKHVRVWRVPQ